MRLKSKPIPKSERLFGFLNTYETVETGQEVTVPENIDQTVHAVISDNVGWPKRVEEARIGELFDGLLNFIDAPLEELESILDKSPTYYEAKRTVTVVNRNGRAIPQTRYFLIKGILENQAIGHQISQSDLEKKLLREDGFDFSTEEYDIMTEYLYNFMAPRCEAAGLQMVAKETVKQQYLRGNALFPAEWGYFSIFSELHHAFQTFADGFQRREEGTETGGKRVVFTINPGSKVQAYDTYVQKRKNVRLRLEKLQERIRGTQRQEVRQTIRYVLERFYEAPDTAYELQLLFEHWDGEESQHVTLRLKNKQPLNRQEFEAARKKHFETARQKIRIIEGQAGPRYVGYSRFENYPLYNVNGLLSTMFRYAMLRHLARDFIIRAIPYCWVTELEAVVLQQHGIINRYTTFISEHVRRKGEEARQADDPAVERRLFVHKDTKGIPESGSVYNEIYKKRLVVLELAEKVRKDISFGEFDPEFGLSAGQFLAFYNVFARTVNALPEKYWQLMCMSYQMKSGMVSFEFSIPMKKGESLDHYVARTAQERQERQKQLTQEVEQFPAEMEKIRRRIYAKQSMDKVLPSEFLLDPAAFGRLSSYIDTDSFSLIQDRNFMTYLINYQALWQQFGVSPYTRQEVADILAELKIPGSISILHANDFIERDPNFKGIKPTPMGRLLWYHKDKNLAWVEDGLEKMRRH